MQQTANIVRPHYRAPRLTSLVLALAILPSAASCDAVLPFIQEVLAINATPAPQVAVSAPATNATFSLGATVPVQWADVAGEDGTTINVDALRMNNNDELLQTISILIGRDARADGESDILDWDTAGREAGRYRFRVTITAPDGQTAQDESAGVVTLN